MFNFDVTFLFFLDPSVDSVRRESQRLKLGTLSLDDICPHPDAKENIRTMDTVHFWNCVLNVNDAVGNHPLEELALFALKVLTMPIRNSDVERVFSVLGGVKTKQRNRTQMETPEALIRLRIHLKVILDWRNTSYIFNEMLNLPGKKLICFDNSSNGDISSNFLFQVDKLFCTSFQPTKGMFKLFTSKMYQSHHEQEVPSTSSSSCTQGYDTAELGDEDLETLTLFDVDGTSCVTLL